MIPESIQTEANALHLEGVKRIYIVIPQEHEKIDMQAKELRLKEMLRDLGFSRIGTRRSYKLVFDRISEKFSNGHCFQYISIHADAILIADEWTGDVACRIEVMLAKYAGIVMLDENLVKAARFNTVNIKFQYDLM